MSVKENDTIRERAIEDLKSLGIDIVTLHDLIEKDLEFVYKLQDDCSEKKNKINDVMDKSSAIEYAELTGRNYELERLRTYLKSYLKYFN